VHRRTTIGCAYGTTLCAPLAISMLGGARRTGIASPNGQEGGRVWTDVRPQPAGHLTLTSGRERPARRGPNSAKRAHALIYSFSLLLFGPVRRVTPASWC
jgi:hypothetical protein